VADALDRVGVDASAKHISLVRAGLSDLVTVGHRAQLLIALGNLVENAVSYSSTYTRVVVDVQATRSGPEVDRRDLLEISVTDQGLGIPESEQQRIFERFYRVDRARSRSTGGTGLGLSIVKHIVAGHQGSVRVWSAPGRGSTFTVTLPLSPTSSPTVPSTANHAPATTR
jgi:two-component system sensor histidine kinase SenX3